jgi:hypothetical protein
MDDDIAIYYLEEEFISKFENNLQIGLGIKLEILGNIDR